MAPLLPKLRGHFAEFLNNGYPARLIILLSSTCVGLRYGHLKLPSSFSRQREFIDFITIFTPLHHSGYLPNVLHYLKTLMIWPRFSIRVVLLSFCVPASALCRLQVVLEYLPVVHRIRLSASA